MAWTFGAEQGNGGGGGGGGGLGGGTAGFGSGAGPFAGNFGSGGGNAGQIVFGDGSGFGGRGGGPSFGQQAGSPGGVAAAAAALFGFVAGGGSQGGQSAVEKSPGFRMRVDSDDGMSDDERGSGTDDALGRGCNRRHDWLDYWSGRQPRKKQKHEEKPKPFDLTFHKLQDCPDSLSKQPSEKKKKQEQKHDEESHVLSLDKLQEFIATWREPCLQHPVDTILESMLKTHDTLSPKQTNIVKRIFTQYPYIGLLNAAVRLIGAPLCPSLELAVPEGTDHKPGCSNEGSNKPRDSVAIDDVMKTMTAYFESNIGASEGSLQLKNVFSLKKLHECESWVTSQFSAHQFSALGHGTFLDFLDRHGHHFPPSWSGFLNGELSSSSSLEVCVMQQQIEVLLCQAESN